MANGARYYYIREDQYRLVTIVYTTLIKIVPCFQKVKCSKIHYMNLFDVFNLDPAIAEKPQNDIDIWDII